ncbi:MAG TPA: hypothetical protein PLU86_07095 [Comamonas denitrificans]|jgi:hypothetical protein|nr:hypothetical protein [Comamonas sp.]HRL39491.1 hypothetical protein [Comamonas denitrificans]
MEIPCQKNQKSARATLASAALGSARAGEERFTAHCIRNAKRNKPPEYPETHDFYAKTADTAPLGNALCQGAKHCAFNSWYRFLVLRFGYISLSFFAHLRAVYG